MLTPVVQRWRLGRDVYRPAGEPIETRHYEVASIPDDTTARGYVEAHHYSGSYVAARFRFGLYRRDRLVGVAVFSQPINEASLASLPGERLAKVDLGRFVLDDDVPANGESWFLARCFERLRSAGLVSVLSLSDPVPRPAANGVVVFGGHIGVIYQASNAVYLGRGGTRTLQLLPDGLVLSARAISKIRAREQGWRYAAGILTRHGAAPLGELEDSRAWLRAWLPRIARRFRHRGHHRYAFAVDRRARRFMPASLPYPKFEPMGAA